MIPAMMKKIILSLFVLVLPNNAAIGFGLCKNSDLQVDYMETDPSPGLSSHKGLIHGTIDVPTPGYIFSLIFDPSYHDGVLKGILTLKDKNPNDMKAQVITPLEISQSFEIPVGTIGVEVEVVKQTSWIPDFYRGDLKTFQTGCLSPVSAPSEE